MSALLAGADPPELVPAKIVADGIKGFLGIESAVGPPGCDREYLEAMSHPIGTPESFEAAAEWAFVLYRDFFGEEPSTGDEDGYLALTSAAHVLLRARAFGNFARESSPLS